MAEIKQPKIRFKGHTNDWEKRKLGEVVNNIATGRSKFTKNDNFSENGYEILGSTGVIGYDSEYDHNGDFLLTARVGANAGSLYTHKGKVKITDNTVFIESDNISFLYNILEKFDLKRLSFGTGQPLIKASELKKLDLYFPVDEEQEKIGEFFKTLDDTIALHQQKLEVTKQFKQTMLKKMFPKTGETAPEIRFKGFTDDWEECKLEDLCSLSTGKLDANAMTSDGKYSFFTSGEKVYKTDTFAFDGDAILIAGNGNVGLQHTYNGKFNAYQRTYVLMDFKINKEILSNQITLELPKVLRRETRVGVIPYIVKDMLTELPINYPRNVREQKSISEYFNTLNSNIFNIECRLESLLNLKQTMLKKLFI